MSCVGIMIDGTRCTASTPLHTNFCYSCTLRSLPSYVKYKKTEERIGSYPKDEEYKSLFKYYVRLKRAYNLRVSFRESFVHPSAWDEGHQIHLDSMKKKIDSCLHNLEKIAEKSLINKREEENESSEESSDVEFSTPSSEAKEEKDVIKKPSSIEEMEIKTPLDVLTDVVGDCRFSHFLLSYLYPLFDRIIHMLKENSPFIMVSPIFKFIRDENLFTPYCDSDFVISLTRTLMPFLFYFFDLFTMFTERSSLLYRFYRISREMYGITFITNGTPYVIYIGVDESGVTFDIRKAPNKDYNNSSCIESERSLYYSYHERYNKDIHIMVDTNVSNKSSQAIYRFYESDMFERIKEGKDMNYHDNPWRRLYLKDLQIERKGRYAKVVNSIRVDYNKKALIFG